MITEIISDDLKPCCVCGKETHRVDVAYECRVCSEDCKSILDKKYENYLREIEELGVSIM